MPEKFEFTLKFSYEIDRNNYPADATLEECLKIDADNLREDPGLYIPEDVDITGRIISY